VEYGPLAEDAGRVYELGDRYSVESTLCPPYL
jgi:hypothetical protein